MPAFIDENQQFIDPDTSAPILNGTVFFGEQGADPESVPIEVFADRALTISLGESIQTDASGRTTQKVWIPGRYSFKVTNSAGSQKLIDLDAGSTESVGVTVLTSVSGGNDLTASADPIITELTNGQQFTLTAVAINTDKMTLKIDSTDEKSILFNFAEEMAPGFIQQGATVNVTYNSTEDAYIWNNEGRGISILTGVAIDIDTTPNAITANGGPSNTGNYVDQQLYSFKLDATNDDTVTLAIGTLPVVPIKNTGVEMSPGQLLSGIIYFVSFDSNANVFELVSGGGNTVAPASATEGNVAKFGALPTQLVDSLVSSLGPLSIQSIAGTGTWTRPDNVKSVLIILTGSGGGGGGATAAGAGAGGGSGATVIKFIAAAASSYAVAIGPAGTGGAGGATSGADGADSSVGSTIVVAQKGFGASSAKVGGAGGTTGTGDIVIAGGGGDSVSDVADQPGGEGGSSYWGGGGQRKRNNTTGGSGLAFGTGGAGGAGGSGNLGAGGGKTGVAFFLEFG